MAERQLISGSSPYERTVGFSRAVRVGDVVFVAGTAPIGPDGKCFGPGDAYLQMHRCLEIIKEALEKAGAGMKDVVRTRIYITDRACYGPVCRAHSEVFHEIRPAATMIVIDRLLEEEWMVEVEAEAVISD
ncbi:MAG: RidA family protein [Fimbriimonadales bacterium]